MDVKLELSKFRASLYQTLRDELGYALKSPEGEVALTEADGRVADLFDRWMKKAFIAGHSNGVKSAIRDFYIDAEYDSIQGAILAERAYLEWKA
jgi:hypothetical protein